MNKSFLYFWFRLFLISLRTEIFSELATFQCEKLRWKQINKNLIYFAEYALYKSFAFDYGERLSIFWNCDFGCFYFREFFAIFNYQLILCCLWLRIADIFWGNKLQNIRLFKTEYPYVQKEVIHKWRRMFMRGRESDAVVTLP